MRSTEEQRLLLTRARAILGARASFTDWCRVAGFEPAAHHLLITRALERLERGEVTKVMLFLPPGSAKSTYASQLFPPWYMARNPKHSVLAASHTYGLAERWSRRSRDLIREHRHTLGIDIGEKAAAEGWQLAPQTEDDDPLFMGEYMPAGTDKAIAGFRGDLGLIDDPLKGREQAQSEDQRAKMWDWYVFDYRPRLKPGAKQVLIQTRWHEEDLAGRILAEESGWEVISVPMIAEDLDDPLGREPGERLWPEWFTEDMVATAMSEPELWNSLYQQRPSVAAGTYWKREWLHAVPPSQVPPRSTLRLYGGSDYAVSANRGDYTVHALVGLDHTDRPWLLDLWRARTTSDVWVQAWCELVKFYRPMAWGEEHGQILSGVGPWLEREQQKHKAWVERVQFVSRADKGVRAQSIRGLIATHGLWYGSDLPHRREFEAELLAFPNGKHDDCHDAIGMVGQLLDVALKGQLPKKKDVRKESGYRPAGERAEGLSVKLM